MILERGVAPKMDVLVLKKSRAESQVWSLIGGWMELRDSVAQRCRGRGDKVNWSEGAHNLTSSSLLKKASGQRCAMQEDSSCTADGSSVEVYADLVQLSSILTHDL